MTYKYINKFPQPFLEDLATNRCIPFIGAGFSKNAELPPGDFMPDWEQLGKDIAALIPGYQYNGALDAISAYSYEYSRTKLIEKLSQSLHVKDARPGDTHKAFCELPFELVCTTNFEFLLERGYNLNSKYCRPIVEEDQLAIANESHAVMLLKFHGDLHHPNRLVITEEDYDGFIDSNPMLATFLANILITKTAFFIGYSLDDSDFRQIWQLIKNRLGSLRRQAYTLSVDCSSHEIARYERRGIKVINVAGKKSDYPVILADIFRELKDYWSKEIFRHSTITDENSLIQLSLPTETKNRLCFFSIPFKLLSFYKKYVFPIAQDFGFVPITADEILSAGDGILAKVSALIDKAGIIVADVSSSFVEFELGMAISTNKRIFLIKEKGAPLPSDISGMIYLEREKDPFSELEPFLNQMGKYFHELSLELEDQFDNEAKRLLEKREYRASVISVAILVEDTLKAVLSKTEDLPYMLQRLSLGKLVNTSVKKQIITEDQAGVLFELTKQRNLLVHSAEKIAHQTAKRLVNSTISLIEELQQKHRTRRSTGPANSAVQ